MAISFAQTQLGKPIDQITEADLIAYFAVERDESLTLEFKSYYANDKQNFDGVMRTVAAFLNSEGGLLVFGAPPEVTIREKYRVVQGNPTPIPTSITTKDSLVRRISDNISYMPVGYRVEAVPMQGGTFVYLIEVQESLNKPHQFSKQYPVRLDGQSVGAPHYLVEALFKQVRRPELKGFLRVTYYRIFSTPNEGYNTIALRFEVTIFNTTASINDTDVYLQLSAETGTFITGTDPGHIYDKGGRRVTILIQGGLITDSLPTKRSFGYQINTQELNDLPNQTFGVRLIFGSKNSTTKYSHYLIDPRPQVNLSPHEFSKEFTRPLDLNRLLSIDREENVSLSEKWQGKEDERLELGLSGI